MQLRIFPALAIATLLVGCRPQVDLAPRPVRLVLEGVAYEWVLAHGVTGSLSLSRIEQGGIGRPLLIMTCRNLSVGGLQIRDATAGEGAISVMAAGEIFSVPSAPDDAWAGPSFSGEGLLPPDWFDMLAMSTTLTIGYGGKILEVPAPGTEAVGHYERYCTKLQNKA